MKYSNLSSGLGDEGGMPGQVVGDEASERLESLVREKLRSAGVSLNDTTEAALADTIAYATERMLSQHAIKDEAKIQRAEASFDRFVSAMIDEAQRRGTPTITMLAFNTALVKLACRIWPVCEG